MTFDYAQALRDAQALVTAALHNPADVEPLFINMLQDQPQDNWLQWTQGIIATHCGIITEMMHQLAGNHDTAVQAWQSAMRTKGADSEEGRKLLNPDDTEPGE